MGQLSKEEMFGYILNLVSIMIGVENLEENRQQTADNDVHKANDKQYEALVAALKKENSEQAGYLLQYMKDRLDVIESKVNAIFYEVVTSKEPKSYKGDQSYKPNYISKKEGE